MIRTRDRMQGRGTLLLGPNCPGVITPDEIKIGIMPDHIQSHAQPRGDGQAARVRAVDVRG
jgi:succinyl-CoA synthetase alpha subunit